MFLTSRGLKDEAERERRRNRFSFLDYRILGHASLSYSFACVHVFIRDPLVKKSSLVTVMSVSSLVFVAVVRGLRDCDRDCCAAAATVMYFASSAAKEMLRIRHVVSPKWWL